MAPVDDAAVAELERRLGVPVVERGLALAALTHKSFVNEHRGEGFQDNERLEFLGDAVIDLAVSHRLMERFPGAREGELSKIRAAVVDEVGLAAMARALDLGSLLRLGRGEELTGGRQKASLLADAMEAVIAALYFGSGLEPVLALVDRFLVEAFARAAAGTLDRDYKTQLQEWTQGRLRAGPRYRVVGERGPDHSKTFEVELEGGTLQEGRRAGGRATGARGSRRAHGRTGGAAARLRNAARRGGPARTREGAPPRRAQGGRRCAEEGGREKGPGSARGAPGEEAVKARLFPLRPRARRG
jgi:ribonuclease III